MLINMHTIAWRRLQIWYIETLRLITTWVMSPICRLQGMLWISFTSKRIPICTISLNVFNYSQMLILCHGGDGEIERRMHLPLPLLEFRWMGSRHKCTFCSKFQVKFDTYSLSGVERSPTMFYLCRYSITLCWNFYWLQRFNFFKLLKML